MMNTMRQCAARTLGAAALGVALALAGAGTADAAPVAPDSPSAAPADGGLLEVLPLHALPVNLSEGLEGVDGLPSAGLWPKLDQINMGAPPEVAALASSLGIPGVNPLDNP